MNPAFDLPVQPGGYAWWYLDAISDDGRHGLTIIAFVGSVFSPYYAHARRKGVAANPLNHCAFNIAVYEIPGSTGSGVWAMTERSSQAVERSPEQLRIGPSHMRWDGETLTVRIDEVTAPLPSRIQGSVRLRPMAMLDRHYPLDAAGRHHWCPMAPRARVDLDLQQPTLNWSGTGYLDANYGERALEEDFVDWHWSRTDLADRRSAVLYDLLRSDRSRASIALAFDGTGRVSDFTPPPMNSLPKTAWQLERRTRCDAGFSPRVESTLENGPFYARSVLQTRLLGQQAIAVHESLHLSRWASPLVQLMLPFRMPRRA